MAVVYRTSILYRTRMVHTVRVYAYGMTVRVWYGYLYHMRIATYKAKSTYSINSCQVTRLQNIRQTDFRIFISCLGPSYQM